MGQRNEPEHRGGEKPGFEDFPIGHTIENHAPVSTKDLLPVNLLAVQARRSTLASVTC
jgi:hypothetical protein